MPRKRVTELLAEADRISFRPAQLSLIEEATALAIDAGDEELEYKARMRMTSLATNTDVVLSSFSWCLAKNDSDPVRFPEDVLHHRLLWQYKWMPPKLSASPIFPRSDIDALIRDMRKRYERAGAGMSGALIAQFSEAWANGRLDEAERLYTQVTITPRDAYSDCEACVRGSGSGFLAEIGRVQEAFVLVEEMIEGKLTCTHQPGRALARMLLPYLRAGRFDEAKNAHLRSYSLSRDDPTKLGAVAGNLIFCAITGNADRGLALLERHIPLLTHDGFEVSTHFSALAAFGLVLDEVAASGRSELIVRGADTNDLGVFFGEHDGSWTVADLGKACWAAAARIAEAFDVRNGNDYYSQSLGRKRALATERYSVPV